MHTDREIIEAYRVGALPALTSETLPIVRARQDELNERFARAMQSPYVGGNPLPTHLGGIIAKATTSKVSRAAAVAALVQAERSTKRRKSALPTAGFVCILGKSADQKSKAQTPVELLVGAGDSRR